MKTSSASGIVIILCILCLFAGFFPLKKYKMYSDDITKGKTNKVAVIELDGMIETSSKNGLLENETGASSMLKSLDSVSEDKNIRGVILKINSPGGTVGMSQNIYKKVLDIREKIPVITVFDDLGASGAYYIASAADRIIAQEGTLTGSIGVIFHFYDYHDLLINKLNVNNIVIKSGKYKDIGNGAREMTEEERVLFQNIVDDSYAQFLEAIINGRVKRHDSYTAQKSVLTEETLRTYADGRIFTGRQAKKLGFIDETGDMDTAKEMITKMMQEKYDNKLKASYISLNKQSKLIDYMLGISEYKFNKGMQITDLMPKSMLFNRRLLYLWE